MKLKNVRLKRDEEINWNGRKLRGILDDSKYLCEWRSDLGAVQISRKDDKVSRYFYIFPWNIVGFEYTGRVPAGPKIERTPDKAGGLLGAK